MTITDRLIAPGATRSEAALCYSAAVLGGAAAGLLARHGGGSALVIVVIALVGFDLFGGAVVKRHSIGEELVPSGRAPHSPPPRVRGNAGVSAGRAADRGVGGEGGHTRA